MAHWHIGILAAIFFNNLKWPRGHHPRPHAKSIDLLDVKLQHYQLGAEEDDKMLLLKADKPELADYVNFTSTQTMTGQKQFNSNIIAASFIKSGADDTVVLLGVGDIKLLSEFESGSVDDSNYVKNIGQATQSITENLI
ncbi:MAG: hypothetical protein EZS28_015478 [Streblomastix strix]|uniref:Uncharacterized protein n=1 Tax=Streblomastix strix TaxID=222440 RepID=A0A5J4W350_9EUKA|nr:MAG: hypothetical protein EZS28_015478 [Streblomastix strix]